MWQAGSDNLSNSSWTWQTPSLDLIGKQKPCSVAAPPRPPKPCTLDSGLYAAMLRLAVLIAVGQCAHRSGQHSSHAWACVKHPTVVVTARYGSVTAASHAMHMLPALPVTRRDAAHRGQRRRSPLSLLPCPALTPHLWPRAPCTGTQFDMRASARLR